VRLLLAVSGGLDSACLLHSFAQKRSEGPASEALVLFAAHVHHGVRGEAADADAALVEAECARLGVPFRCLRIDCSDANGKGFEATARQERYRALLALKEELGCDALATAHHQDDQVETLALRLLRGTGLKGLRGILERREDGVWRPFLSTTRAELAAYAQEHQVPYREDASNEDCHYRRNLARKRLLPALGQDSVRQMARIATLAERIWPRTLQQITDFFDTKCQQITSERNQEQTPTVLTLPSFVLPKGYRELFKIWLSERGFSWEKTAEEEKLFAYLEGDQFFQMRIGKGIAAERRKHIVRFNRIA
jgi:tRNA(Ile)-lysidine synthase